MSDELNINFNHMKNYFSFLKNYFFYYLYINNKRKTKKYTYLFFRNSYDY